MEIDCVLYQHDFNENVPSMLINNDLCIEVNGDPHWPGTYSNWAAVQDKVNVDHYYRLVNQHQQKLITILMMKYMRY